MLKIFSDFFCFTFSDVDLNEYFLLIIDCKGNLRDWDSIRSSLFGPDYFPIVLFDVANFNFIQSSDRPDLELQNGKNKHNTVEAA